MKILHLLAFTCSVFCFAQIRISYNFSEKQSYETQIHDMNLDIIDEKTTFYNADFLNDRYINYTPKTSLLQVLIRKTSDTKNELFVGYSTNEIFKIKSNDTLQWTLTNEQKIDNNYTLQKATTSFAGRDWEAWFCSDFAFSEGPFKFNGLPGLVFEVKDSEGLFSFQLTEIKNLTKEDRVSNFFHKKYPYITWEKLNKMLYNLFEAPSKREGAIVLSADDRELTTKDLDEQDKRDREEMIKHCPIFLEKDKMTICEDMKKSRYYPKP